jgi:hypothetical protein
MLNIKKKSYKIFHNLFSLPQQKKTVNLSPRHGMYPKHEKLTKQFAP